MQPPDQANERPSRPRVLFVYYTYTQQTRTVVDAMAEALRERGCDVQQAAIEFTDSRYATRFSQFPLHHAYRDLFGMIPAQLRGATDEIRIPDAARAGDYDGTYSINVTLLEPNGNGFGAPYSPNVSYTIFPLDFGQMPVRPRHQHPGAFSGVPRFTGIPIWTSVVPDGVSRERPGVQLIAVSERRQATAYATRAHSGSP